MRWLELNNVGWKCRWVAWNCRSTGSNRRRSFSDRAAYVPMGVWNLETDGGCARVDGCHVQCRGFEIGKSDAEISNAGSMYPIDVQVASRAHQTLEVRENRLR